MNVAVVGGGVIGLSIARRLVQGGAEVTVYDPGSDDGAWWGAAGMLAAAGEQHFGERALERLMAESARRWPAFAAELGAVGYDESGTLHVALTADDVAAGLRMWRYQGLEQMRPGRLRVLEPALSPRIRAGALAVSDRQVDPRRVVAALRGTGLGGTGLRDRPRIVPKRVARLSDVDADKVVVAAGCGTAALTGLPIRPVKGQVLRLRAEPGLLRHVISGSADGRHVYLVPRADGEVVVGATQEERTDLAVTAGGVLDLLRAATDLVPALSDAELIETHARHRPATPDNAPLLGALNERTVVAAGHFRNGVLLAPVTADLIAGLVLTGTADPLLELFAPGRPSCA